MQILPLLNPWRLCWCKSSTAFCVFNIFKKLPNTNEISWKVNCNLLTCATHHQISAGRKVRTFQHQQFWILSGHTPCLISQSSLLLSSNFKVYLLVSVSNFNWTKVLLYLVPHKERLYLLWPPAADTFNSFPYACSEERGIKYKHPLWRRHKCFPPLA